MAKVTLRELPVVTMDEALCKTDEDARMFLHRVIEESNMELVPLESSTDILAGRCSISFCTAVDGKAYTMTYAYEAIAYEAIGDREVKGLARIMTPRIEPNDALDTWPREYSHYRITFYDSAETRIDPFEFAWLLSKHNIEVAAKADNTPTLFVRVRKRSQLIDFIEAVCRHCGRALIFKCVEGAGRYGYEEIDI